jgi:hypothetical protein
MAKRLIRIAVGALFALSGCSRVDGMGAGDGGTGAGQPCAADLDCGAGRYCSEAKICALDCVTRKDCAFLLQNPSQANTMDCSPCGRCIEQGTVDESCIVVTEVECEDNQECRDKFGEKYVCGPAGSCVRTCKQDMHCAEVGRGWYCGDDQLCFRKCTRDLDCILHGWNWRCPLPAGVDGDTNAYEETPIVKECEKRDEGVDWGGKTDPSKPANAWQGVWGMMLNTAVRTIGLPIINQQDTVSNQYLLMKLAQDGDGLVFNLKWCTIDLKNFKEDDSTFQDPAWIITPDRYVDHIFIQNLRAVGVPNLSPGASFDTDKLVELRGARLANPETDELPNWNHPEGQWDQDNDGNPGMTNFMAGMITAEIYNAQRWTLIMHVNAVDNNHIQGLVTHTSKQNVLGSSNPDYVYDTTSIPHPQADRSFFKALRMDDAASCNDVIAERKTKGSWIEFDITKELAHYNAGATP